MDDSPTIQVEVKFFAVLREQAGVASFVCATAAQTPAGLYQELQTSHRLTFPAHLLRVAVNDRFTTMHAELSDGDRVVFIPPVAGG